MSTPGWERLKANKRRVNAKSATQSIPSDHASQAAVRRLIPPTPRPPLFPCPFCHDTTLQHYRLLSVTKSVQRESSWTREAREEASASAVVATDSASVNADYDNGTVAVYGTPRYRWRVGGYPLATLNIMARQTIDEVEN